LSGAKNGNFPHHFTRNHLALDRVDFFGVNQQTKTDGTNQKKSRSKSIRKVKHAWYGKSKDDLRTMGSIIWLLEAIERMNQASQKLQFRIFKKYKIWINCSSPKWFLYNVTGKRSFQSRIKQNDKV
jgi:hypothetical protein